MPPMLSKHFAHQLALAIEAECITHRHYIRWADRMIDSLERPPAWLSELATTKYKPEAVRIASGFAHSEPFEDFRDEEVVFLGFLWLRYKRRELSWATFLREAGRYTDPSRGRWDCERFYSLLNELEEHEFSAAVEKRQHAALRTELAGAIKQAKELHDAIRRTR